MSEKCEERNEFDETPTSVKMGEKLTEGCVDMITQTRKLIKNLSEEQRFTRARVHVENALKYKNPQIDNSQNEISWFIRGCSRIHNSFFWENIIKSLSFIYPYLTVFQSNSNEIEVIISITCLALFWIDLIFELVHTSRDFIRKESKYSRFVYAKATILILLIVEECLESLSQGTSERKINPLRILRCALPILFVSEVRRSFEALISAYKDFFMFIIFDSLVIVVFALIGNILIKVPETATVDQFTNNYSSLDHMIFNVYVCGSYDSFPDNQLLAFQISKWFQLFFVFFIFLNMFLFSSIPGSLLFDTYISTRSKYILIDEIKMQHSLILAFVTLGEVNYQISIKTIVSFFHFLFEHRIRYIDAITQLCLKLNSDGNCTIHVLEFIKLGRILQEHPYLQPPILSDIKNWISFRQFVNNILPFNSWLKGKILPGILSFVAISGVINAFLSIYNQSQLFCLLDKIFSYIFLLDIFIRIIGDGLENYINGEWNTMDCASIIISFFVTVLSNNVVYSAMFKFLRIVRFGQLAKVFCKNKLMNEEPKIVENFKEMLGTIIIIIPITTRFMPLFMIVYYILGIIGMEIFYDTAREPATSYGMYDEFSNFKNFIGTQFYLVQVLTEAGWSMVAWDYSFKNNQIYYLILLFFVFCHMVIVLVLAAVLKGIIWFVYITVTQQIAEEKRVEKMHQDNKEIIGKKVEEFFELQESLEGSTLFKYDTVMKRYLFELKSDLQILNQISKANRRSAISHKKQKSLNYRLYREFKTIKQLIKKQKEAGSLFQKAEDNFLFRILNEYMSNRADLKLQDMQQIEIEDIEQSFKRLVKQFNINTTKFEFQIEKNPYLQKHLVQKLKAPFLINQLDDDFTNHFTNKKSLEFHVFAMHLLLDIKTQRKKQKSLVIDSLSKKGIIDECDARKLLYKSTNDNNFKIDDDYIIREMYLADTNKYLIDKFESQYFSDIYGPDFKQTNKQTIEPLIKLESTLTYALKKLMRCPQMNSLEFFKVLGDLESKISNNLLKEGSIFKIMYQVNKQPQTWFTVHYTPLNETRASFVKHGAWVHHSSLVQNEIYHAKDFFKTGSSLKNVQILSRATLMKKLFQSFQSIALALTDSTNFFTSNPAYHVYDLYLTYINVQKLERLFPYDIEISKIMVVLLTREEERLPHEPLEYPISDIMIEPPLDLLDFRLNEPESQTYKKINYLYSLNDNQITASEGLPFANVLNFLCEISDVLKLYAPNLVYQTETVLQAEIEKVGDFNVQPQQIDEFKQSKEKDREQKVKNIPVKANLLQNFFHDL